MAIDDCSRPAFAEICADERQHTAATFLKAAVGYRRDSSSSRNSTRVFYFGALAGARKKLEFGPELLYVGAMFHDIGLTPEYRSATERFEVDSAMRRATSCIPTPLSRPPSTSSGTPSPSTRRPEFSSTRNPRSRL